MKTVIAYDDKKVTIATERDYRCKGAFDQVVDNVTETLLAGRDIVISPDWVTVDFNSVLYLHDTGWEE